MNPVEEAAVQAAPDADQRWPRCPDGCGCRLGTDDPDLRDCGCDGPCTMECRENGYPDAPSYRDTAVAQATSGWDDTIRSLSDCRLALAAMRAERDQFHAVAAATLSVLLEDGQDHATARRRAIAILDAARIQVPAAGQ